MNSRIIVNLNDTVGERLDLFLSKKFPDFSRSYLSKLIKLNRVKVNNEIVKPRYIIRGNDKIDIDFPSSAESVPQPEDIHLDIVYEDDDVVVVNKQPGLVVHPAGSLIEGTLVNALLGYFPKIRESVYKRGDIASESRPGLVHRLDKDTSGIMIVAKNPKTMHSLSKAIQERTVIKIYWALVHGWPKNDAGRLVNFLGRDPKNRLRFTEVGEAKGREAISNYKVLQYLKDRHGNKFSLVEFNILTGRTHQIRVQSRILGNAVVGDPVYSTKENLAISKALGVERQMLHSKTLEIKLPKKSKSSTFEAPISNDFSIILEKLSPEK